MRLPNLAPVFSATAEPRHAAFNLEVALDHAGRNLARAERLYALGANPHGREAMAQAYLANAVGFASIHGETR